MGRTISLTLLAMTAFAANSVLCRLALGAGHIDAASFASIRVISGALILAAIVLYREKGAVVRDADWRSVLALFAYMTFFSFAYLSLGAGTGALILFGAVQLTMFIVALRAGEYFSPISWTGLLLAISGLVYLISPGVTAPASAGAAMMVVAGVAWGFYSLLGRKVADATRATAWNFLLCVPLVLLVSAVFLDQMHASMTGVLLAIASGTIASGIGYVIWYAALRTLKGTTAATVQLSVPIIAAVGGVVLLAEEPTLRLAIASTATLGGVVIVLLQRKTKASS